MSDRPFATSFNQPQGSDDPGLVLGDDNVVYLVKPDGSRVPVGAAQSNVQIATATITNDQILSIVSTPAELVAPTEHPNFVGQPSSWLLPVAVVLDCDFTAGEYTNVDAGMLLYVVVSADWELTMLTYFHHGAQASAGFAFGNVNPHYVPFLGPPYWDGDNPNGGIADNGLYLAVSNNGLGDFTGGDPANEIRATIFYIAT